MQSRSGEPVMLACQLQADGKKQLDRGTTEQRNSIARLQSRRAAPRRLDSDFDASGRNEAQVLAMGKHFADPAPTGPRRDQREKDSAPQAVPQLAGIRDQPQPMFGALDPQKPASQSEARCPAVATVDKLLFWVRWVVRTRWHPWLHGLANSCIHCRVVSRLQASSGLHCRQKARLSTGLLTGLPALTLAEFFSLNWGEQRETAMKGSSPT